MYYSLNSKYDPNFVKYLWKNYKYKLYSLVSKWCFYYFAKYVYFPKPC